MFYVSVVNEAVHLLEHRSDCILFCNMSSISILATIILHELHAGLHASEVCRELNDILVLLQALRL